MTYDGKFPREGDKSTQMVVSPATSDIISGAHCRRSVDSDLVLDLNFASMHINLELHQCQCKRKNVFLEKVKIQIHIFTIFKI